MIMNLVTKTVRAGKRVTYNVIMSGCEMFVLVVLYSNYRKI